MWKINPRFAEWIASPKNALAQYHVISNGSTVLELGCGVCPIIALLMKSRVSRYIATDQDYVLKRFRQNLAENARSCQTKPLKTRPGKRRTVKDFESHQTRTVEVLELDWEHSCIEGLPDIIRQGPTSTVRPWNGLDIIVACDCIINEKMVVPFVNACVALCRFRKTTREGQLAPTVCVVAQQLRSPEVFEEWLARMTRRFHVFRVSEDHLPTELGPHSGHAVHLAILKEP